MGIVLGLLISFLWIGIAKFITFKFGLSIDIEMLIISLGCLVSIVLFGRLRDYF